MTATTAMPRTYFLLLGIAVAMANPSLRVLPNGACDNSKDLDVIHHNFNTIKGNGFWNRLTDPDFLISACFLLVN